MNDLVLKFHDSSHNEALLEYNLPEDQLRFTALPKNALDRIAAREDQLAKAISILADNRPIGFVVLDYGQDKFELTDHQNALMVRSFSINPFYQGKGYGKKAMQLLDEFVKEFYPSIQQLVLAVNFENKRAYQLYLSIGYQDLGKFRDGYHGDKQHLLTKII